jgi:8-amino-7-oxononanoate synthase
VVIDFLVNRGRAFVFSTAPSPLTAAAVRAALRICRDEPQRRERLAHLVEYTGRAMSQCSGIEPSGTQILPVIIGEDRRAVALAERLQGAGFDVRAVRPPTVPEGTARLRIAVTLNVDEAAIDALSRALGQALVEGSR